MSLENEEHEFPVYTGTLNCEWTMISEDGKNIVAGTINQKITGDVKIDATVLYKHISVLLCHIRPRNDRPEVSLTFEDDSE